MEFHEKLQELRHQRNMTQEELAAALFVSRTAISKWESGRGYPNLDSLKAIAKFYHVTIDALLSNEELLTLAEEENLQTKKHDRDLVFGMLDVSASVFFFLPLFGQKTDGIIREVSLLRLSEISLWIQVCYVISVVSMILWGVATLALQNCRKALWVQNKNRTSLLLNGMSVFLFIISLQPYPATLLFLFLAIKVLLLIDKP